MPHDHVTKYKCMTTLQSVCCHMTTLKTHLIKLDPCHTFAHLSLIHLLGSVAHMLAQSVAAKGEESQANVRK